MPEKPVNRIPRPKHLKPFEPSDEINRNNFAILTKDGRKSYWSLYNKARQVGTLLRWLCKEDRKLVWLAGLYSATKHSGTNEYPQSQTEKEELMLYLKGLLEAERKLSEEEEEDVREG